MTNRTMIRYVDSVKGIKPEHLEGFFQGWPDPPSPQTHLRLLENSDTIILAVTAQSARVVGFITAISDHVLSAYIPFLEVRPEYRGRGIGSELVRRMLERFSHLYMIDLVCDADLVPFYAALGMHPITGMKVRNYDRQSGEPPSESDHRG